MTPDILCRTCGHAVRRDIERDNRCPTCIADIDAGRTFQGIVAQVGFRRASKLFATHAEAEAWAAAKLAEYNAQPKSPYYKSSEDTYHYWIQEVS